MVNETVHTVEQFDKLYFVIQCLRWVSHNLISVSSFLHAIASQLLCGSPPNSHVLQELVTLNCYLISRDLFLLCLNS